ncbi:MAG TPA: O-antigen ligase family protein [Anaerolineae bacterium]|nr:O-antigen ligase family protein [Anaerolineae bacterium]HOQ99417.1 O-antigen ligase family protein [Anaerolineae bacterium]HPL27244.1 O-antigen ligase family protein [Anaerolineae bacterium]
MTARRKVLPREGMPQTVLQAPGARRVALIVLTLCGAVAVGASSLAYALPYAPLLAGGALVALTALIIWIRKPVWALYAAIFVVFLPIGLIPTQIQSLLNRIVTVTAALVWLLDVIARRRRVVLYSTSWLMLGFLAWSGLSLLWAENLSRGANTLQVFALRLLLFLLLLPNEIQTQEHLDGLMNTLALNGWALVLVGAYGALRQGYTAGTRFQVLSQNENGTGIMALVALVGVLWQVLGPGNRPGARSNVLAAAYLVLALALTAMSGSRGSAISMVVALLALCLWRQTRPWGAFGLLMLAVAAISAPLLFSTTLERFTALRGDTLLGGREALWKAAWWLIRDHPMLGVGLGNVPDVIRPYVMTLRAVWDYDLVVIHNPPLTIWAETGLPGIALYLGALGAAVTCFVRRARGLLQANAGPLGPYMAVVAAVSAGYLCSWIKGGGMESDYSYFLMLALLVVPSLPPSAERQPGAGGAGAEPLPEGAPGAGGIGNGRR